MKIVKWTGRNLWSHFPVLIWTKIALNCTTFDLYSFLSTIWLKGRNQKNSNKIYEETKDDDGLAWHGYVGGLNKNIIKCAFYSNSLEMC